MGRDKNAKERGFVRSTAKIGPAVNPGNVHTGAAQKVSRMVGIKNIC